MQTKSDIEMQLNQEVADFFGMALLTLEVSTYNDKNNLDKEWVSCSDGKYAKAPDWLVAFATYSGQVHILSPDIIPAGYEKTRRQRYIKTLKHEIAHLYTRQINKNIPSWLNEGISLYIAEQNHYKKVSTNDISLSLLNDLEDSKTDGRIYQIGIYMVDEIIMIGGKDLLFEIINIQDRSIRNNKLQETFSWLQ